MRIEKRTMNWLPRPSLYEDMQAKRAKQKAAHEEFLSSQSNLANTIGSIQSDFTIGQGTLVADIAATRLGLKKSA
ncbi:MAG TPA: hypothetical protein VG757_03465 [Devosia sp.]|nr:hypothetical protein [Devosia sp.]